MAALHHRVLSFSTFRLLQTWIEIRLTFKIYVEEMLDLLCLSPSCLVLKAQRLSALFCGQHVNDQKFRPVRFHCIAGSLVVISNYKHALVKEERPNEEPCLSICRDSTDWELKTSSLSKETGSYPLPVRSAFTLACSSCGTSMKKEWGRWWPWARCIQDIICHTYSYWWRKPFQPHASR